MSDAVWSTVTSLPGMTPDEAMAIPAGGGKTLITFHTVQKKHNHRSKLENRPVYYEVTHIRKMVPGDNKLVVDRPVRESDKEEFPVEWARWEKYKENRIPGIPIENWHSINETQKAEFKALNIFTIEQFANLPDSAADKIMGFNELRQKARVFVEAGKDAELLGRVKAEAAAEADKLRAELAELRALIEKQTTPEVVRK